MSLLATIALTSAALMSPPMQIEWATAEIVIGGERLNVKQRCGVENARVLVVLAQQNATNGMSRDERKDYEALVERIESDFPEADQREQAMLMLDLLKALKGRTRIVSQAWVVLDELPVVLTYIFDSQTGNMLFTITDDISGAYASYTLQPSDSDDWNETSQKIRDMLDADNDEEKLAIADEINRESKGSEARFEVNGEVVAIHSTDPEFLAAGMTAFPELWPKLEPPEGRRRIEMAISILWKVIEDQETFKSVVQSRIWAHTVYPDSMGHDPCILEAGVHFVDGLASQGGMLNLYGPTEDTREDFFGDNPIPMPDPDLSWKELVEYLR